MEETVRERLSVYYQETYPLVEYYKALVSKGLKYIEVDGQGHDLKEIQESISKELSSQIFLENAEIYQWQDCYFIVKFQIASSAWDFDQTVTVIERA